MVFLKIFQICSFKDINWRKTEQIWRKISKKSSSAELVELAFCNSVPEEPLVSNIILMIIYTYSNPVVYDLKLRIKKQTLFDIFMVGKEGYPAISTLVRKMCETIYTPPFHFDYLPNRVPKSPYRLKDLEYSIIFALYFVGLAPTDLFV